jgi:hypothetical protein
MSKAGDRKKTYPAADSTPSPGRQIFVEPHSPWQLAIEEIRARKEISIRTLAAAAKIPDPTLYNWLRSKSGRPQQRHYSANINRRIAAALGMTPAALAEAYNRSVPQLDPDAIDPEPRAPAPQTSENLPATQVDGLRRLRGMLRASEATSFTLAQIEQFIDMLLPPQDPA